ncbi:MAG: hypothetical protein DLM72_14620 [Candidatus Nitrosopolaris wilkensis]|nr:MAG: hypothetical protein DLM72_14620 [Candidatus Nitrosopolaris wilkensis]
MISIKATGSGTDPEIMPRLFSKFTSNSPRGTGLGLFISKRHFRSSQGQDTVKELHLA